MDAPKLCKIGLLKIDRKMQETCIKEALLPFPLVEPLITSVARSSFFLCLQYLEVTVVEFEVRGCKIQWNLKEKCFNGLLKIVYK